MTMKIKHFLRLLLVLLIISCKPDLPPGILSDSEMESVLYDFHMAQAMSEINPINGSIEERRYELQQAVLRKHQITQADFDSSMSFYCSDLERMNIIYSHLAQRMEREADALGTSINSDVYAGLTAEGDTANMWVGRQIYALKSRLIDNIQSWQQTCDSTWLPGDDILFRFQPTDFSRTVSTDFYASVVVVYTNDSVRGKTLTTSSRTDYEIRIEDKEGWTPASISGHFYLPAETDPQLSRIFIINKLSLIRFHKSQEWRNRKSQKKLATDTLATDSTELDSLKNSQNILHEPGGNERRLSPKEFRESQPVDRKIDIVKEKPYQIQKKGRKRRKNLR